MFKSFYNTQWFSRHNYDVDINEDIKEDGENN